MKWRLPLVGRSIGGIDCNRPDITLWVRSRYGDYAKIRFVVDTASDFTAIPIPQAQEEGIAFPRAPAQRGTAGGLVGRVEKYLGSVHVRIGGEEFDWPCDFLVLAPAGRETPAARQARTAPVLGRAGFLAAFAIGIDGGYLTVRRRPSGPWWRRLLRALWPGFARYHPVDETLGNQPGAVKSPRHPVTPLLRTTHRTGV
jgi:hypothetical protein